MVKNECHQIGVVSFGESCSMGHRPTVYASIAPAYGWIEKSVCSLSDNPPSNCQATITVKEPVADGSENNGQVAAWRLQFQSNLIRSTGRPTRSPSDAPFIDISALPSDDPSWNSAIPSESPSSHSAIPSDSPTLAPKVGPKNLNDTKVFNTGIMKSPPGMMKLPPGIRKRHADKQKRNGVSDVDKNVEKRKAAVGNQNRGLQQNFFDLRDMPTGVLRLPKDPNTRADTNNSFPPRSNFDEESRSPFTTSNSFGNDSSEQSFLDEINSSNSFGNQETGTNPISFAYFDQTTDIHSASNSLESGVVQTIPMLFTPKLGECQGDCDSDEDCAEGLYCFMRDGGMGYVPGCRGFDPSRTDYCVKRTPTSPVFEQPLPILFVFPENPPLLSDLPLQHCQGDCDRDFDCADGLICYTRPAGDFTVPGCSGISVTRTDFCVDLNWSQRSFASEITPDPTISPTRSPSSDPTISPTRSPSSTPSQRETSYPSSTPSMVPSPTPTHSPTAVKTRTRSPTQAPTKLPTLGPTQAPTLFPTEPRTGQPTNSPTLFPTKAPTGRPTTAPTFSPTKPSTRPPTNPPTIQTQFPTKPGRTQMQQMKPRSQEPTKSPTPSPSKTETTVRSKSSVSVTFAIYFDPWPQELSWKVEREDGQLVASVPTGTYQSPQDHMFKKLLLEPGDMYVLTITDAGGDGIAGVGTMYEVFLTNRPKVILLAGNGVFEDGTRHSFIVPTKAELPPKAPIDTMVPVDPNVKTLNVYLVIVFDNWHQETAWEITDEIDPNIVYAEKTYDTYRSGDSITEEIVLPAGRTYTFTVKDFFNDGIKDGEYLLMSANGDVIFKGSGEFGSFRSHTFTLPEK